MFLHLSKLLWSIAGLVLGSIVFVGAARAVSRRGEALALAVVLAASASLAALTLPPVADALEGRVAASGRTTMRPAIEYDVAIVLSGTPLRASAAAEVVRSGRARYLLHSGMLDEAEIADLTSHEIIGRLVYRVLGYSD